jgi:hypothetical protein
VFDINKNHIDTELPLIVANFRELLVDEIPILYTGTNKLSNRIIGSIINENKAKKFTRYLHSIVDHVTYNKFINKEITYLFILETIKEKYFVDESFNGEFYVFAISFEDIPKNYLPSEDSFCPSLELNGSLSYGVSLKGKDADSHIVDVQEESNIQTSYCEVFKNAISSGLGELELNPRVFLEPAGIGSFRVNYRIEFGNRQTNLFQIDDKLIANYLTSFFNYLVSKLKKEEKNSLKEEHITSEAFKVVEDKLRKVYENSHYKITKDALEQKLIDNINESASKFEDVTNQIINSSSFDKIELINYEISGGEIPLGLIDKTFFESIKEQLVVKEPEVSTDIYEEDLELHTYRIRVYHLSTLTGNCWAFYYFNSDTDDCYKIPIRINKGEKEYSNNFLSKSLDEDKVINIQGKAERINSKVTSIYVDL